MSNPTRHGPARAVARRAVLLALLPAVAFIATMLGLGAARGIYVGDLLRDASSTQGFPPWTGLLSTSTVLLWTAGSAVALAAASNGRRADARTRLSGWLGLVTLGLALDDQFLLHEDLLPRVGVPENAVLLVEAATLAVVLLAHSSLLRGATETVVLGLALLLLGLSVGVDLVAELLPEDVQDPRLIVEDGAKLCGAALLLRYLLLLGRTVPPRVRQTPPP